MTINERTSLLPKEYQKTYVIPIPQDDENNNISGHNNSASADNAVLREYDSYALTKAELNKYIDDPWWIRMRYGCFAFCWIVCLIALAISLYIAGDALRNDHCGATNNSEPNVTQPSTATGLDGSGTTTLPLLPIPVGSTDSPTNVVLTLLAQQAT